MQLQGNPDQYDRPEPHATPVEKAPSTGADFDEADLEFLLKYIAPTYLTPDILEQISEHFEETSSITLSDILHPRFAARLREHVEAQEKLPTPVNSKEVERSGEWRVARPPHKHRYLYLRPAGPDGLRAEREESPVTELLDVLLPSRQFRQWLQLATGCTVEGYDLLARRFRKGLDYTLATGHEGKPRLELNLGFTPTPGWGDVEDDDDDEEEEEEEEQTNGSSSKANGSSKKGKGKGKAPAPKPAPKPREEPEEVGGHEVYMAGDDDQDGTDGGEQDAAVYKSSDSDDNILFFQAAAWNKLTIVLRDSGALRFVKYVSRAAKGDRWDISATYDVEERDDEGRERKGGEDGDDSTQESELVGPPLGESEDEFNGFSDSYDSDSD
jgi:hypothetical protein